MALHSIDINKETKETSLLKYCVCVEINEKIYKFKITFEHMDIVNLIEYYTKTLDRNFFKMKPESSLNNPLMKKYFPYAGKYRLKGKLIATDNYFVPPTTGTLEMLFSIYENETLEQSQFIYLGKIYEMSNGKVDFVKKIFDKANIELFDIYTLEEFNTSLNLLDRISGGIRLNDAYFVLKELLIQSKENNKRINDLGITDKFINAIENGSKKNKIKKHN